MRLARLLCSLAMAVAVGTLGSSTGGAATTTPTLKLTKLAALGGTTAMAVRPGDSALYVTQQGGKIRAIRRGALVATAVADLSAVVSQDGGERGLLGLAFSTDGSKLYVDYTARDGNTRVDELAMGRRVADRKSRRTVITVEQPQPNHNGGQLAVGPDGMLYIGLGDGGAAGDEGGGHAPGGNGQSLGTMLGKILRIDPHPSGGTQYTVPTDNPFVGQAKARPEIWALGLRNPWRFSFDTGTGDLWIADVGQNDWEEIDRAPAVDGLNAGRGDNFGWNRLEGTHRYRGTAPTDAVPPVYQYEHGGGVCSVTGGFVYGGAKIPALRGAYLFADFCVAHLMAVVRRGGRYTAQDLGVASGAVSSFGQDNDGELYVLSQSEGIFRIDPRT